MLSSNPSEAIASVVVSAFKRRDMQRRRKNSYWSSFEKYTDYNYSNSLSKEFSQSGSLYNKKITDSDRQIKLISEEKSNGDVKFNVVDLKKFCNSDENDNAIKNKNEESSSSFIVPTTHFSLSADSIQTHKNTVLHRRIQRKQSGYGISITSESTAKMRCKMRKLYFLKRNKVCDFSLLLGLVGLILIVIDSELTALEIISKSDTISWLLRGACVASTALLIWTLIDYHRIEVKISLIDSGADDWRVAVTTERLIKLSIEIAVCGVCPFPGSGSINWLNISANSMVQVPLDVMLSVPMFLRSYLLCRFMVLHSRQFQDAATRSIAALNRISMDFRFVIKTMMADHPLTVLIVFTVSYWICMSWMFTQCERYNNNYTTKHCYMNSLWFIMIHCLFFSVDADLFVGEIFVCVSLFCFFANIRFASKERGDFSVAKLQNAMAKLNTALDTIYSKLGNFICYGDVVPNSYCGRLLAITTGIVGAGVSSALIAVISRKLELSRAEKHVNNFMADSKLTNQRKNAAALVLQHTWFIHKYQKNGHKDDDLRLRQHQRKFLNAINEFRRIKWDQRKLQEKGTSLLDVGKLHNEMHETLWEMHRTQDQFIVQIDMLTQRIIELQTAVLKGQISATLSQHQQNFLQPILAPMNFIMSSNEIETSKSLLASEQQQCTQHHSIINQKNKNLKSQQNEQQLLLLVSSNKSNLNKNKDKLHNKDKYSSVPLIFSSTSDEFLFNHYQKEKPNILFHPNSITQTKDGFKLKSKTTSQKLNNKKNSTNLLEKSFLTTSNNKLTYNNQTNPTNELLLVQHQLNPSFSQQELKTLDFLNFQTGVDNDNLIPLIFNENKNQKN